MCSGRIEPSFIFDALKVHFGGFSGDMYTKDIRRVAESLYETVKEYITDEETSVGMAEGEQTPQNLMLEARIRKDRKEEAEK